MKHDQSSGIGFVPPPKTSQNVPGQRVAKAQPVKVDAKIGRNDSCPCGSEKKYKKCCGKL